MLDNHREIIANPQPMLSHTAFVFAPVRSCVLIGITLHELRMKNNCVLELELQILHLFVFIGFIK